MQLGCFNAILSPERGVLHLTVTDLNAHFDSIVLRRILELCILSNEMIGNLLGETSYRVIKNLNDF